MFHTVCMFLELSNDYPLYKRIDEVLPKFSTPYDIIEIPADVHIREYKYRSVTFKDFNGISGIRMCLTRRVIFLNDIKAKTVKSYLHMTINPKAVNDMDYINVANEADGIFALNEIDKLLHRMGLSLICSDFKTSRIDVCYNHRFCDEHGNPSEQLANEYLALLKRGPHPNGYELGMKYYDSQKRWLPYDNALVFRKSHTKPNRPPRKYIVINVYDKFSQLQRKAEGNPDFEDKYFYMERPAEFLSDDDEIDIDLVDSLCSNIENDGKMPIDAARGIIRFEIQLYNDMLQTVVRDGRQGIESRNVYNFISDSFTENMLRFYLKQISFPGDYYTFAEAKQRITNSGVPAQPKTKERLLALLTKVSRHKAWSLAYGAILESPVIEWDGISYVLSESILNYLTNKLKLMGINPITIPQDWTSKYFRSPDNLVCDAISLQREIHPDVLPIISLDGDDNIN